MTFSWSAFGFSTVIGLICELTVESILSYAVWALLTGYFFSKILLSQDFY